ncbi:hypothetical protein [Parasitella parasitica]|uniref:Uncharacterized protein n=1 Tax=Parasitella parasitica TaxID=35722 RepID=A0A0B7NHP7_9FUNG|nr:hypothetical protein [Parasitella parasitica]
MATVALFIILSVLLFIAIISLAIVLYKKRCYLAQRSAQHIWHDFVMIDSPEYMIALKNSDSLSFDSRRRRSSIPMFHHNNKPLMPDQLESMSSITLAANDVAKNSSFASAPLAPQSPAPVYMPAPTSPHSPNKKLF